MKKKIIVSTILFVLAFLMAFSICFATEIDPISEESADESNIEEDVAKKLYLTSKEISEENYYRLSENLTLEGKIINGNAFICAANVTLKDIVINGDVFICANKLNVETEAALNGNVFICASNINIDGKIARELYVAASRVNFGKNYTVMYDANVVADYISLEGTFYRNFNSAVSNLEIKENANIMGNLNYASDKEATINENATISNINFDKQIEKKETVLDIIEKKVLDFAKYFILTMIVFIVLMKFLPDVIEKSRKNLSVSAFGIGIVSLILIPIIFVLLLLFRVFTTVVFAALALFMLVLIISIAIANIAVASVISNKKPGFKLPISVPIITVLTWCLYQIPFIGGIFTFIWITTGLGISVKNCFTKKES